MTIDEAIARTREIAKRNREQWKNCPADRRDIEHQTCEQCAEEHEQLAEWLEDYKQIKMLVPIEQELKEEYNKGYADGSLSVTSEIRNKVIDECLGVLYRNGGKIISIRFYEEIFKEMEHLKEGGENEI